MARQGDELNPNNPRIWSTTEERVFYEAKIGGLEVTRALIKKWTPLMAGKLGGPSFMAELKRIEQTLMRTYKKLGWDT